MPPNRPTTSKGSRPHELPSSPSSFRSILGHDKGLPEGRQASSRAHEKNAIHSRGTNVYSRMDRKYQCTVVQWPTRDGELAESWYGSRSTARPGRARGELGARSGRPRYASPRAVRCSRACACCRSFPHFLPPVRSLRDRSQRPRPSPLETGRRPAIAATRCPRPGTPVVAATRIAWSPGASRAGGARHFGATMAAGSERRSEICQRRSSSRRAGCDLAHDPRGLVLVIATIFRDCRLIGSRLWSR